MRGARPTAVSTRVTEGYARTGKHARRAASPRCCGARGATGTLARARQRVRRETVDLTEVRPSQVGTPACAPGDRSDALNLN
jgi:hypothetical protein